MLCVTNVYLRCISNMIFFSVNFGHGLNRVSICSFCLISAFPVCTTASFPSPQTELCVSGVVKEMFTSIFVIKKKKNYCDVSFKVEWALCVYAGVFLFLFLRRGLGGLACFFVRILFDI